MAAPPLDSPCDGPVTYPGDIKTLIKSSKGRRGPTHNMTTRLGLTDKELENFNIFYKCSLTELIQGVPLATEPGISLIILTPMKILQRNLNRSTFFSFTFLTQ